MTWIDNKQAKAERDSESTAKERIEYEDPYIKWRTHEDKTITCRACYWNGKFRVKGKSLRWEFRCCHPFNYDQQGGTRTRASCPGWLAGSKLHESSDY